MIPTTLPTMVFYLPRTSGLDSIICSPAAVDTTSTDYFDFGGITVHRATGILSWFGDFATVDMSFVTTKLFRFFYLRFNALM